MIFSSLDTIQVDRKSAWCALSAYREASDNLAEAEKQSRQLFLLDRTDPLRLEAWLQTRELQERVAGVTTGLEGLFRGLEEPSSSWVGRVATTPPEHRYSPGIAGLG